MWPFKKKKYHWYQVRLKDTATIQDFVMLFNGKQEICGEESVEFLRTIPGIELTKKEIEI